MMSPCECGKDVALRARRISVNRRHGVAHWIEHGDGSTVCPAGAWSCVALKPYPKDSAHREYAKLLARWDARRIMTQPGRPDGR